uniref:Uncharacterized protein n=1 Tax=Romanomermis culicivorax TaxID=13658 RepID=A0A915I9Q4_ROMCU
MSKLTFDRFLMNNYHCPKMNGDKKRVGDENKSYYDDEDKDSTMVEFRVMNKRQLEEYGIILKAKNDEIEQLNIQLKLYETNFAQCLRKIDRLNLENEKLKAKCTDELEIKAGGNEDKIDGQMTNGQDLDQSTIIEFKDEYLKLRQQFEELKDMYESADVEAEAKITLLANRIEDLEEIVDDKNRECIILRNELNEKIQNFEQAENKAQNFSVRFSRQKDLTENLRDELEKLTDKSKELAKEKNDLLTMNASLNHELNIYKKKSRLDEQHILEQVNMAGRELQECIDNLRMSENYEKSKNASISNSVANLAWKIDALEKDVNNKQRAINNVEDRLQLIRSALMKKYSLWSDRSS